MKRHASFLVPGFYAAVLLAAGCAHKPAVKAEAPAPPPRQQAPTSVVASAPSPGSCTVDADCANGDLCVSNRCTPITTSLKECSMFRVHFDFDRSVIHDTDKADLDRMARCLKADQAMRVTIEGNADERGTEEYNLHLGDRRAQAVEKYLIASGVTESQLKTISYGKDRPLCTEHEESCWSQNRRDALKPRLVASANLH